MSRRVGTRREGFGAAVIVMVGLDVVGGFLSAAQGRAELCLWVLSSEWAVVTSRLRSEMKGSSGLGQRKDVDMVLRLQSWHMVAKCVVELE